MTWAKAANRANAHTAGCLNTPRLCLGRPGQRKVGGLDALHRFPRDVLEALGGPPRAFAFANSTRRPKQSFAHPNRFGWGRKTAGPVSRGVHHEIRAAASRKPRLLFRLSGVFLLRFAERQFLGSLFQLPPRFTRFGALAVYPKRF